MDAIKNTRMKIIILSIVCGLLFIIGITIFFEYNIYRAKEKERQKVIFEIYELHNKDNTKPIHEALIRACIGDKQKLGSYVKAEKGK